MGGWGLLCHDCYVALDGEMEKKIILECVRCFWRRWLGRDRTSPQDSVTATAIQWHHQPSPTTDSCLLLPVVIYLAFGQGDLVVRGEGQGMVVRKRKRYVGWKVC